MTGSHPVLGDILALTEPERIAILTAGSTVIVALIGLGGVYLSVRREGRRTREELSPGNGHSIGDAVHRIEDTQSEHGVRLDSIEVQIREGHLLREQINEKLDLHLEKTEPLVKWAEEQMEEEDQT
jgi:hypothetical protein